MASEFEALLEAHRSAGHFVDVDGVRTFVRDEGAGEVPVVCVHGVPVSSYLWRKLLPELSARGLRGVAPDFPGLGLSARPVDLDYSWTGLGKHLRKTLDALDIQRFHLVVHDIGGPVGLEVAARVPERVASLTILNTMVEVHTFRKPWPMRPFAWPVLDWVWLNAGRGPVFRKLMRLTGLSPQTRITDDEIAVHQSLLLGSDGAQAFRKIMRGFETTRVKTDFYAQALSNAPYPVQVLWGVDDPLLKIGKYGLIAARFAGVDRPTPVPGRHFFPEDSAAEIADHIVRLTR
ncbi:alpha/beta fold hydrolase [Mycobacterium shigaense]|uniref:Hydrolase n=1 Tax=Mycobacterium shigaense TaxID=722731 RepID=A0A1Z4EMQ7_9MYCO|nr:alpha/beta fold hydrolase [Mycobacterium shigaense]MEA1120653.1 alpha/beta fold hydrolase [Mycobacterium shigaense]PRI13053.1 haloalkane dehalogenase [Mycobacterium shigaense]BAX94269.1 hydrolase [Mycobacterium shigaense]